MKFDTKHLSGDVFGGLTAGIVALPLALGFGVTSGLPPEIAAIAGLYGAIAVGIFAAIFGGTPTQVSGPTGPMTVVAATVVATGASYGAEIDLTFVFGTFALAGVFQILMGIFRLGGFIRFIPHPVVSGFMSGIGVLIVTLQWFPTFGQASPTSPLAVISRFTEPLQNPNWTALGVTLGTVALIWTWPRITKKVPGTLVGLIVGTGVVYFANLDVPLLGKMPSGLPELYIPAVSFEQFAAMIPPALSLALLGAIDSLLTSVVADNITRTRHDSNRELIGQGIGNTIGGLIGGLPGAGATMRTVVNVKSGGKTRLSGTIHGVLLLAILLGLGPLAALVPKAVLAGILITVGIAIIDYKGLRRIAQIPRADAAVLLGVLGLTVFVDLLWAVAAGVALSAMMFIKSMSDLAEEHSDVLALDEDGPWADEADIPPDVRSHVVIKHLDGPMFFGFSTRVIDLVDAVPDCEVVVIRLDRVPYMDHSGLVAIEDAVLRLRERDMEVVMTGLQAQPRDLFQKLRIVPDLIPENHVFDSFDEAKKWIIEHTHPDMPSHRSALLASK